MNRYEFGLVLFICPKTAEIYSNHAWKLSLHRAVQWKREWMQASRASRSLCFSSRSASSCRRPSRTSSWRFRLKMSSFMLRTRPASAATCSAQIRQLSSENIIRVKCCFTDVSFGLQDDRLPGPCLLPANYPSHGKQAVDDCGGSQA